MLGCIGCTGSKWLGFEFRACVGFTALDVGCMDLRRRVEGTLLT